MAFSGQALARGMANRCARCGAGGIFRSYYKLHPTCRTCGMRFERESGEWTGALIVIIAFTEILFALWLGLGLWFTWPDVPWTLLLIGGILLNLVVPIVLYPWSQSVWIGLHYSFVPLDTAEEAEAVAAIAARTAGSANVADITTERPDGGHEEAPDQDPDRAPGQALGQQGPDEGSSAQR